MSPAERTLRLAKAVFVVACASRLTPTSSAFAQDDAPPSPPISPPSATGVSEPGTPAARPGVQPPVLRRPDDATVNPDAEPPPFMLFGAPHPGPLFRTPMDPPNGFTGKSSILPRERQTTDDFVPIEDRWRLGFPLWDRYGKGHPWIDDYPYQLGRILDPFNQNVLKGDYPIAGQHTFLELTPRAELFYEPRQVPTPASGGFESTARPLVENFFGRPSQFFTTNNFILGIDLFHGDAGFKPVDWRFKAAPTFNVNNLSLMERGIVSPNVLQGTTRTRQWFALQEAFFETKLFDVSSNYDFTSMRIGTQPFIADFRGFLFVDQNLGVRFFGTRNANRDQWNLAYFSQWEKDTNSLLNSFNQRGQQLVFANYYRQDFIFPGYTVQASLNYNYDPKRTKFDKNRFLVRPDPTGVFQEHSISVGYFGLAGDGKWGRFNVSNQFYWAFGRDSLNPLANQAQTINAQMAAFEGSYDRDWARFRASFFWASGDGNINNSHATGFDTILDQPNFAGGPFSYWNRQQIPLFGVNLVQRLSLVPDLRSSKVQGQANFVNPGIYIPTLGVDFDLTPKLKMLNNMNMLWFEKTNTLEQFLFDGNIDRFIGFDLSTGFEYRPLLSDNVVMVFGVSTLLPGQGFRDLYNNYSDRVDPLVAGFVNLNLQY